MVVEEIIFEFDGHKFGTYAGPMLWAIEMAYRARRGDVLAIELLTTFKVSVLTIDGKHYWPDTERK